MSSVEWPTLIGTRVESRRVHPKPPADLICAPEDDSVDSTRFAMRYATPVGVAWVLERRRRGPKKDVVVWGDVPAASLEGVIPRLMIPALRTGVTGCLHGEDVLVTVAGSRPWLVGRSALVVQSQGMQWRCRTRRLVDVDIERTDRGVVGRTRTHLQVPRTQPVLEPIDLSVAIALLHGGWLNAVRGALSNVTAGDPMTSDTAATVAGAVIEALAAVGRRP